jgi:alanine racemase
MRDAEVLVDLAAVRGNAKLLRHAAGSAELMAVVKADGYGHGAVEVARAALDGGASWLGVCYVEEALELRAAGITAPVLAWLTGPGTPWRHAVRNAIDVSVSVPAMLTEVTGAGTARVHLELDTGLGRGGATARDWPALMTAAAEAERAGTVRVVGVWSHLACADLPGHPSVPAQLAAFREALRLADGYGLRPSVRHVANSAATLTMPAARFDLVRPGVALYGIPPVERETFDLRPAMSLYTRIGEVTGDRSEAKIPVGVRTGLPGCCRAAQVQIGRSRHRVIGGIGADCCAVEAGAARPGDDVVVFGPGDAGEPTAVDWAAWAGTIAHEVVTQVGNHVPRRFVT